MKKIVTIIVLSFAQIKDYGLLYFLLSFYIKHPGIMSSYLIAKLLQLCYVSD